MLDSVDEVTSAIGVALKPILSWFSSFPLPLGDEQAFGVSMVVTVLTFGVFAVVGVVFMWWGVRKVVQMIMSAFRSGRISL